MKSIKWILGAAALLLWMGGGALADQSLALPKVQLATAFPDGWTLVTPENAEKHAALLGVAPEIAALYMESENLVAAAFAPVEPLRMSIQMTQTEETALYFDIERYTTDMRRDMRALYQDTAAWKVTGYRFSEVEWKYKTSIGRYLRMSFTRREGEEIVGRGLMAVTIRNGRRYTLKIEVEGRRLNNEEIKQFEALVNATRYTPQLEMPLLPTGLSLSAPAPEEVNGAGFTLRGSTRPGATVRALLQAEDGAPFVVGETLAKSSGNFTLPVTLTEEGAWYLHVEAFLQGFDITWQTTRLTFDQAMIPVNLSAPLSGEIWAPQPLLAGATLAGATLTMTEGETVLQRKTGDGNFSFKLDPMTEGARQVTLTVSKEGYADRTLVYDFQRLWRTEDLEAYLTGQLQRLSYANLIADPAKYTGRMVKFSGMVTDVSEGGGRAYVRLAVTDKKNGQWADEMIFLTDADTLLGVDDLVHCYGTVTGESFPIPLPDTQDETGRTVNLPALTLLLAVAQ